VSSLPTPLRRQLESAVRQARTIAEAGARHALEALAVHEPDPYRHMDESARALRRQLRAQAKQLGDGESRHKPGAYEIKHLAEKLAYDQWHRLLFARYLLENKLLISPEHGVAVSLDDCEELAPSVGLKDAWAVAARFAARELPEIFRADDPAGAVELAVNDRQPLIALVTGLALEVFTASDSLGWCYQFWQAEKKDEVNKPLATRSAPTNCRPSRSCSPRTTWWTSSRTTRSARGTPARFSPRIPNWQTPPRAKPNFARLSRWRAARGSTCASSSARTASGRPPPAPSTAGRRRRKNSNASTRAWAAGISWWRCSSGWCLALAEEKLDEADAVDAVIRDNLFGLEIDPRCTQIGAFNLALAAWRRVGHCALPAMNLACSGLAPNAKREDWLKLAGDSDRLQRGMARLYTLFKDAPTLGSLVNPCATGGDLVEADFDELQPLLEKRWPRRPRTTPLMKWP
jgi:hypothetical protein